jgi:hypothetical protein
MHPRTHGARSTVRLGLESLEARTLLSATLPAPSPAVSTAIVHHTDLNNIHVAYALPAATAHTQTAAASVRFSYHWKVGPSTVIIGANPKTANGKSSGNVDFALVRDGTDAARLGGQAAAVPLGFIITNSDADDAVPDRFHAAITLKLTLHDAASGASRTVTFKALLTGTLSFDRSTLVINVQGPLTQKVTLGQHVYTVRLPGSIKPAGPTDVPTTVFAFVAVSPVPHATHH